MGNNDFKRLEDEVSRKINDVYERFMKLSPEELRNLVKGVTKFAERR